MQKVVLDTNALLLPFERSVNLDLQIKTLLGNCEVYVPLPILGELKKSKNKFAAAALKLASNYNVENTEEAGDYAVIELAMRLKAYVVTNDAYLVKKLREKNIQVVRFKSNSHLDFD